MDTEIDKLLTEIRLQYYKPDIIVAFETSRKQPLILIRNITKTKKQKIREKARRKKLNDSDKS